MAGVYKMLIVQKASVKFNDIRYPLRNVVLIFICQSLLVTLKNVSNVNHRLVALAVNWKGVQSGWANSFFHAESHQLWLVYDQS